jgi:hypothetical protein
MSGWVLTLYSGFDIKRMEQILFIIGNDKVMFMSQTSKTEDHTPPSSYWPHIEPVPFNKL